MSSTRSLLGRWVVCLALLALTLYVRLWPAWNLKAEAGDLPGYRAMAQVVLRGDNIYSRHVFFPYTPYSQFLQASMLLLANSTGWRFDFTVKLPAIFADAVTLLLLYWSLLASRVSLKRATAWSVFWALNPVSILVSAFHGNVMSLVPCFLLGAIVAAEQAELRSYRRRLMAISALMLGLGIAMRSFPILALPVFLALASRSVREAIEFTVLAGLAGGVSSIPYLIYARETFLREVLSYSGFSDFGWVAAVRAMSYITGAGKLSGFDDGLLVLTKSLFLYAYVIVLLMLPWFRRRSLAVGAMLAPLLFYGLYGGLSAQYLVWVIPMAILAEDRLVLWYSPLAALSMACFYAIYHPGILFGSFRPWFSENVLVGVLYAASSLMLALVSMSWVVRLLIRELRVPQQDRAAPWYLPVWFRLRGLRRVHAALLCVALLIWSGTLWQALSRAADDLRRVAPRGFSGAWVDLADFLAQPPAEALEEAPVAAAVPSAASSPTSAAAAEVREIRAASLFADTNRLAAAKLQEPRSLRFANGTLFALDFIGQQFVRYSHTGDLLGQSAFDTNSIVLGMDVGPDQKLYFLDAAKATIWVYDLEGHLLEKLPPKGMAVFNPRGFSVAPDGSFYVADTGGGRILHVSREGTVLDTLGGFVEPSDVCVGEDQTIAIADGGNSRLVLANLKGETLAIVPIPQGRGGADGMRLDRYGRGRFLVANADAVWAVDRAGSLQGLIGASAGIQSSCCGSAIGVAWNPEARRIYVSDKAGHQIHWFTPPEPVPIPTPME